jgi:hypothetical protein
VARGPLAEESQRGDFAAIQHRLETQGITDGEDADLALVWASYKGYTEIARILLEYGADPHAHDSGNTALGYARAYGHPETAELLMAAVQQPRKVPQPEKWVRIGEDSVAFVGLYPAIDKKLTQIFNFETREHTSISENLQTRSEGVSPVVSFDTLTPQSLDKALDEFERLGGKPDRDFARYGTTSLNKPRRLPSAEPGQG